MRCLSFFIGLCVFSSVCLGSERVVLDDYKEHAFEFAITNSTETAQTVRDVRFSCACLRLDSDVSAKIGPGEALPIRVVFNPAGMEGPLDKTAEFALSPSGETVAFPVSAFVKVRCGIYPCRAALGAVNMAKVSAVSRHLSLGGYAVEGNSVRLVAATGPSNSVFSVSIDADGRGLSVGVAKEFAPRAGSFAETWRIATTDAEVPVITLPVGMDVIGDLEAIPSKLTARRLTGCQSLSVLVRPLNGNSVTVLGAGTKPRKWGDVKLHRRGNGGWKIDVEEVEYEKVRQFSKQPYLEITTDSRQMPVVKIPLEVVQTMPVKCNSSAR